jgi:hypothetical protein
MQLVLGQPSMARGLLASPWRSRGLETSVCQLKSQCNFLFSPEQRTRGNNESPIPDCRGWESPPWSASVPPSDNHDPSRFTSVHFSEQPRREIRDRCRPHACPLPVCRPSFMIPLCCAPTTIMPPLPILASGFSALNGVRFACIVESLALV